MTPSSEISSSEGTITEEIVQKARKRATEGVAACRAFGNALSDLEQQLKEEQMIQRCEIDNLKSNLAVTFQINGKVWPLNFIVYDIAR